MITSKEFVSKWSAIENEKLLKFNSESLNHLNIDNQSKIFLIEAGLPASASPFLEFEVIYGKAIPTASEKWGIDNKYSIYKCIGSNGSGDPICINEINGNIIFLNHDDDFKEVLINSSIFQLAESLLAYALLAVETINENGEEAFLDNSIPKRLKKWIADELKRIDEVAVNKNCFWGIELSNLE